MRTQTVLVLALVAVPVVPYSVPLGSVVSVPSVSATYVRRLRRLRDVLATHVHVQCACPCPQLTM